ncbi:hypothetical protein [Motiliproteus sediminis]|uniref:hypothetical protein n=1 Tax=Motiliproteus sediminis TaxID=1468178 RepID=UPI001AEF55BD|nr:hypothetical protein [Motiliproteus sediminis]
MKRTLARYKRSTPVPLEISLPVDYLQDEEYCMALSEDIHVCGNGWETISSVDGKSADVIPKIKGVYVFVWRTLFSMKSDTSSIDFNQAVYVGSASKGDSSLRQRFINDYQKIVKLFPAVHWTQSGMMTRDEKLKKVLNLWELDYWFVTMEGAGQDQIEDIEDRLIALLNPPGNTRNRSRITGKVNKDKRAPAFEPAF